MHRFRGGSELMLLHMHDIAWAVCIAYVRIPNPQRRHITAALQSIGAQLRYSQHGCSSFQLVVAVWGSGTAHWLPTLSLQLAASDLSHVNTWLHWRMQELRMQYHMLCCLMRVYTCGVPEIQCTQLCHWAAFGVCKLTFTHVNANKNAVKS